MSYQNLKQLIIGGKDANGVFQKKITGLPVAEAQEIIDKLDLLVLAEASIDTTNVSVVGVLQWAKKSLATVMPTEEAETVELLREKIESLLAQQVSDTSGSVRRTIERFEPFTKIETHNLLAGDGGRGIACSLSLHDQGRGLGRKDFENSVDLYVNGDYDYIHYENEDEIDHPAMKRDAGAGLDGLIVLPPEEEWAAIDEASNQREKQRSLGLEFNLTAFSIDFREHNCSVSTNGKPAIYGDSMVQKECVIEGVEALPEVGIYRSGRIFTEDNKRFEFTIKPEDRSQEAVLECLVTAPIDGLSFGLKLNEMWFEGKQDLLTEDQLLGFFTRYIGAEAVEGTIGIGLDSSERVTELKRLAQEHWAAEHRETHKALYDELKVPEGTVLLSYGKVTKAAQVAELKDVTPA